MSSIQDKVKSRELGSGALYVLPSRCPEQSALHSDAYTAADAHQEEGKTSDYFPYLCSV